MVTYAEWLRAAMYAHGFERQEDLAAASGVKQQVISKILTGKTREPHLGTIRKLGLAFGLTQQQILDALDDVSCANTAARIARRQELLKQIESERAAENRAAAARREREAELARIDDALRGGS
jgi:transcriptional regulator with XRE-family HTH domain